MTQIYAGQRVKFAKPIDAAEASERYIVLEPRGDRALLGAIEPAFADWAIKPTFVYDVADLCEVQS